MLGLGLGLGLALGLELGLGLATKHMSEMTEDISEQDIS